MQIDPVRMNKERNHMTAAEFKNRCEAVFCDEKKVFGFALILGTVISIVAVFVTSDIYRDVADVYAYYAREIGNGDLVGGFVGRVPMLHILLAGALSFLGVEAYRACITVSCLFYVLTLFPLRSYLRRFLPPLPAAYGCLLFVAAPKLIRASVSGGLDPGRYFFLIGALLFLFRLIDKPTWRRAVMFGLCAAGEAVSRGEGIMISLLLLAGFPVLAAARHKLTDAGAVRRHVAAAALSLLVFVSGITPFCAGNFVKSGAFVTDVRMCEQAAMLKRKFSRVRNDGERRMSATQKAAAEETLLRRFYLCFHKSLRGGFEVYWAFSAIGIVLLLRTRRWRWEFSVLIMLYLIHQMIYFVTVPSHRYSIYLVPMFMPLTVSGVQAALDAYRRWHVPDRWRVFCDAAIAIGAAIIFVSCLADGLKFTFGSKCAGKREVAVFIRKWGEENFPGRRLKIADDGSYPEIVYWSGAYDVNGYDTMLDWKECLDIADLLMVDDAEFEAASANGKLEWLKTFSPARNRRVHLFGTRGASRRI